MKNVWTTMCEKASEFCGALKYCTFAQESTYDGTSISNGEMDGNLALYNMETLINNRIIFQIRYFVKLNKLIDKRVMRFLYQN